MDKDEELRIRRKELKQRIFRQEQRARFKALLDDLDQQNKTYQIIWAQETADHWAMQWLENNFSFSWGRIDWSKIDDVIRQDWYQHPDLKKKIEKIISSQELGNPQVFLVGSDAKSLSLELPLSFVVQHTEEIFMANWDSWIVCPAAKWVFEIYHEGEICFGRV